MHIHIPSRTDHLIRRAGCDSLFQVTRRELPVPHLPEAFHGLTIVQVSDLHIDRWNRALVESAIPVVNALKPDLIVCTGDTIANSAAYLPDVTHLLGQLQARHGKLACLGNHDYSDGSGSAGVRETLRKAGFDVLVNDRTVLTLRHQQLQLAAADDLILGRQCLVTTQRRLDTDLPTLMLSHNPENFEAMARLKPFLILSGHTHGGQVRLPAALQRRIFRSPYIAGLYQMDESHLYVNRGLGSAVFVHYWQDRRIAVPTPRWLVHPEVSVIRLINPALNEITGRSPAPAAMAS